jgi:putative ABC transport system permease protein
LPGLKGWRAQLSTMRELTSGDVQPALLLLLGAVTFVLLIACVNVANLMLARGAGRAAEFAVRKALGAKRHRLIQQLLTESLLIATLGAGLGVLVAVGLKKGLVALAPPNLLNTAPELARSGVDPVMLAFTVIIAVAACVIFGLAPALSGAKSEANDVLKTAGKGSLEGAGSRSIRSLLVVTEIALSVVLLVGAGLMIRTLVELSAVRLGLNPENVLTMRVPLAGKHYEQPEAVAQFWKTVVAGVEALPDVESASVARGLPIADWNGENFTTGEQPNPPAGQVPDANYEVVGPNYFHTLQIPVIEGRSFTEDDAVGHERVAIVSQELVRRNWPNDDALGKRVRMGSGNTDAPWMTVIGVAGEVLSQGPQNGRNPQLYVCYRQYPWVMSPKHLIVRVRGPRATAGLVSAITREIHRVDPNQPVVEVKMLRDVADEQIAEQHMVMTLLVGFGALALLLAAVGTYSVLAYSVAQRTREIGLRMAMGAEPGNVLRMVLGNGTRLAITGIVLGILAAMFLTQLMTDLLFGVHPLDPSTFVLVSIFLAAITLAACYLPARRAAHIDPMVALRYE